MKPSGRLILVSGVIGIFLVLFMIGNNFLTKEMKSLESNSENISTGVSKQNTGSASTETGNFKFPVIDPQNDPLAPMVQKLPSPRTTESAPSPENFKKVYEHPLSTDILVQ